MLALFLGDFYNNTYLIEYGSGLIFINIAVYLFFLSLLFSFFFLLNNNFAQNILNFKTISASKQLTPIFILAVLSLAGVPPLSGFVSKMLLIMLVASTNNYALFIALITTNIFMLYFYIQITRFIITKDSTLSNKIKCNRRYTAYSLYLLIATLSFLNLFGVFFFEDLLVIASYWSSFLSLYS